MIISIIIIIGNASFRMMTFVCSLNLSLTLGVVIIVGNISFRMMTFVR